MNTYTQKHTNRYARTMFAQGRPRMVAKPPSASGEMESVAVDRTTNVSSHLVLVLSYTSRAWTVKAACIPAVAYESPSPSCTRSSWIDVEFGRRAECMRGQPC